MGATSNRHWMMAGLLALFVSIFVLVSVADAKACGSELEPPHATSSVGQPVQSDDAKSGDHALCAHGHCHHGGVVLPQPTHPGIAQNLLDALALKPSNAPLASHSPSGLKRPPRG